MGRTGARPAGGSPPTVVLVHGLRASRSMWLRQLEALDRAGVPASAPDLPGHGSRRGEPFTIGGALAAVEEAARSAAGDVVVAGASLGGYLAVHWAATTARRPAAVLAAACSTRPRGIGLNAYRRLAALIECLPDQGAGLHDTLARRVLPAQAVADLAVGGSAMGVMDPVLAAMGDIDPLADLRALGDVPVWLVNGRWDHFRLEERAFLAACADGRLVVVPGATHLVPLVRPVAFTRVLLELVDAVDAQRRASSHARTPPTMPALLGTTTTSSPSLAST